MPSRINALARGLHGLRLRVEKAVRKPVPTLARARTAPAPVSALALVTLVALAALLPASRAQAFTLNRNDAHIQWRTIETEHFRFNYPAELEPVAGFIAGIAENVAEEKMKRYNIRLPNKVEFIIREDIFSNGWANSLQNTMNVWISDWDFPIRSTHNWLRDVVTHEFSHLVSIQSSSKLPSPIQGLVLGYQGYYNAAVQPGLGTIIPFTSQPDWFAEGTAQYESEYSGYDAWDSHRDMLLRTAALSNKLLSYDRMGSFAGTSLEYELGPYTQGFAFVKYIAGRYGDAAMIRLWAENARMYRQTLSGSMERVLGKDGYAVWEDWKNTVTAQYDEQVKNLGTLVMGQKLTSEGFYNYYPRWNAKGDGLFYVSNRGRDDFKGSLYLYNLPDTTKKKEDDRVKLITPSIRSPFDVAADDSTFLYNSAKETDSSGMHKLDVWQKNPRRKPGWFDFGPDPTVARYTKNLNAVQASFSKDGKRIVFVRNHLTNFYLCTAPAADTKAELVASKADKAGKTGKRPKKDADKPDIDPDSIKTLFPTPADTAILNHFGYNIYTPRFSPDGKSILFSYYDGVSRNIGLIQSDGTGFKPILARPYDERDPEWSPDGKSFFFSADSNQIYNIYRCEIATGKLEALTQVTGGAFAPAVDPTGKKLAYVGYDTSGFSLFLLPEIKPIAAPAVAWKRLHPDNQKIESIEFEGRSEPYTGIPNRYIINPILIGEEMSARTRSAKVGESKWLAGVNGMMNDPVLKNEISAALLAEVGNGLDYFGANSEILSADKESQFYLSIENHALPVTLGAAFARGNLTTHDTVKTNDVDLTGNSKTEVQGYAVTFRNAELSASYNLFDANLSEEEKSSFVRVAGGYTWNDFNFYQAPFSFNYYHDLYLSTMASFYGSNYSDKELVAPQGLAAAVVYTYNQSSIIRGGSFSETFDFSGSYLRPRFRDYTLHELDAGATYGLGLPWSDNGAIVVSGFVSSILDWKFTNRDTTRDTLDSFFSKGMFLRGYPYLRDIENLAFQGENSIKFSADLNQPLVPDIYKGLWVLFIEDLYADVFYEAGRAWNGSLASPRLFNAAYWDPKQHVDGFYQSVGWGLKLNAKIYHNYPFLAYFEAATALSGIPNGTGGLTPLETVKIKLGQNSEFETYATRISFGISFGLYNGLLGDKPARNPFNPESPFAKKF